MNGESLGLTPSSIIILLNHVKYSGVAAAQPILDRGLFYVSVHLN